MTDDTKAKCLQYARSIRNRYKRQYAEALIRMWDTRYRDRLDRGPLSVMAAQAVYMHISEIVRQNEPDNTPADTAKSPSLYVFTGGLGLTNDEG